MRIQKDNSFKALRNKNIVFITAGNIEPRLENVALLFLRLRCMYSFIRLSLTLKIGEISRLIETIAYGVPFAKVLHSLPSF